MPRGRIKSSPLIVGTLAPMFTSTAGRKIDHQVDQDRRSVIQTLDDYIRAWFSGDAVALERCLHPELTARMLQLETDPMPASRIQSLARSQGIQAILGACTHPLERHREITILDIGGRSASARAILGDWSAYVHLSFTGERWAIVNVLWEWLSPRVCRTA